MRNRMESVKMKSLILILLGLLVFLSIASCQQSQNVIGKWQEVGKMATLEFRDDHTFSAVDNMGMAVSGTYSLDNNGNIRFEIKHGEPEAEIIDAKVTFAGDELIFNFGDKGEVEKYRRVKP
jgi:hypothetical protein